MNIQEISVDIEEALDLGIPSNQVQSSTGITSGMAVYTAGSRLVVRSKSRSD